MEWSDSTNQIRLRSRVQLRPRELTGFMLLSPRGTKAVTQGASSLVGGGAVPSCSLPFQLTRKSTGPRELLRISPLSPISTQHEQTLRQRTVSR